MNDTVDGEFQKFSVAGGAYIREHFFGAYPKLLDMVRGLSDDDLIHLRRGGHDMRKLYTAYAAACATRAARRSSAESAADSTFTVDEAMEDGGNGGLGGALASVQD